MAKSSPFYEHLGWEDWVVMALAILMLLSPWIAGQTADSTPVINASLAGVVLVIVAGLEMARLYRWHEYAAFLIGLWMLAAPSFLGYESLQPLAGWHQALGAGVAFLSVLEIWQDWRLTDLAEHGR
jgi:hypothetical protein